MGAASEWKRRADGEADRNEPVCADVAALASLEAGHLTLADAGTFGYRALRKAGQMPADPNSSAHLLHVWRDVVDLARASIATMPVVAAVGHPSIEATTPYATLIRGLAPS
jgi:hypothetical protein